MTVIDGKTLEGRAAAFDAATAAYLAAHPKASVVALGDGLHTSFWRLDAAGLADDLTWYSIDLRPAIARREALLPQDDRIVNIAQSVLDRGWMDRVDTANGVFLTAEGLFMYLDPAEVRALIADCAARFPGGQLMFDSIPPFLSRMTLKGWKLTDRHQTPPMPFGINADNAVALADQIPGVRAARDVPHRPGRGIFKVLAAEPMNSIGVLRRSRPSMTLLDFGPPTEDPRHKVDLSGVPETALMTLQVRAGEARRDDGVIDDPLAVTLVDSIDYDFAKFGHTRRQDMALRAIGFDEHTSRYLTAHPQATVVALAEGLQTSFYRLDTGAVGHQFHWVSVDLPPMIELRKKLLPASDRVTMLAQSALEFDWMDHVDASNGVFITAEGLLMYLQPDESMGLIAECAKRFPGGQMMFDLAPAWAATLMRRGARTSRRYRIPPMPFSLSRAEADNLVNSVPGVRAVHHVQTSGARGVVLNTLIRLVQRFDVLEPLMPVWLLLEFG